MRCIRVPSGAREMAEILAANLPGLIVVVDCDLCEMHNGEANGLTWQEDDARYGRFNIVEEPCCPFAPGAESWDDVMARVRRRLEEWQREMSVTQSESSRTR